MKNLKIKQIGISLLELTLVSAIIAIILVLATRFYYSAAESRRISDANDQISALQQAFNRWLLDHPDFSDFAGSKNFDQLVKRNYLPETYLAANNPLDPWNGGIIIANAQASSVTIAFYSVNCTSGDKLVIQNTPAVCNPASDISSGADQEALGCTFQITFHTSCNNNNKS